MVQWCIEAERQNPEPSAAASLLWRIEMLGSAPRAVRVGELEDVLARFPTQKTGALLALLALPPGRPRTREEVTSLLWPDAEPGAARDRLSQALVWLRPRLEPSGVERGSVLHADRRSLFLNPEAVTSDVATFDAALTEAQRAGETDSARRKAALLRAVRFYRGELLPGYYDDWVLTERRQLRDAVLEALRALTGLYATEGDYERAIEFARRATTVDALDEGANADLIRLLAASGQTTAAVRQFHTLTTLLARELGAAPSAATLALIEQIRSARRDETAVVPSLRRRSPGLPPTALTRFFGREAEIARLRDAVLSESARLITITGAGGAGKTRLALAASAELAPNFEGAVAFVPLADLEDAGMIPVTLAAALGLPAPPAGMSLEATAEALGERPFLLVLDNLEHLLGSAIAVVRDLLDRVPTLTLVVTSRQRLGLEGEREVPVPPLPLPPDFAATPEEILASTSVQLFVDRARAVRPDFVVTTDNADAVAHVCARLEGIPLAIELCAAWAQTLTPAQMLDHLSQRFDLLVSRRADITPRHRTLRAALEYSYLLLPAELRTLFTSLSVFRGGWTLEAAAAVCGSEAGGDPASATLPMLAGVTELRERSLVVAEEEGAGAEMRYRMLETLREFASDLLPYADREARRQAHAACFLRLAERDAAGMTGPEPERWLSRLDRERENLRAALTWSLEDSGRARGIGLRLGRALGRYWAVRGPLSEGSRWLRALLERAEEGASPSGSAMGAAVSEDVIGDAWGALGHLTWSEGEYVAARDAHRRALARRRASGDEAGVAESLYHLGITAYRQDDYAAAREYLDESLALAKARGDRAGIARVLLNLGNIASESGEGSRDEARALYRQSLELEQELGNRQRVANAFNNLGLLALVDREYEEAAHLFEAALAVWRELTDSYGMATALANLGTIARLRGERERARALLTEGLRIAHDLGDRFVTVHYLLQLGLLATSEADTERGVLLISAAHHLFEDLVHSHRITDAEGYAEAIAAARAVLGDAAFERTWAAARGLPLARVVAQALLAEKEAVSRSVS